MKSTEKNMKCTWPAPAPRIGDPMPPIFHLLALGVGAGGNTNYRVSRWGTQILAFIDTNMLVYCQHEFSCWEGDPMQNPNASSFASQWNIGLSPYSTEKRDPTQMKLTSTKVKCTWPTLKFCVGDPTQPVFH